jgi:hypothetical protein
MRKLTLILMILIITLWVNPVYGQSGLSDEEAALRDRAAAALAASQSYMTYVEDGSFVMDVDMAVAQGHMTTQSVSTVQAEPRTLNAQVTGSMTVSNRMVGDMTEILTAEVRFVDDTLYVNAEREIDPPSDADLYDPMPEGWIQVDTPDDWSALGTLMLDDYGGDAAARMDMRDLPAYVFDWVTSVRSVSTTLDDSTPVDAITLDIRGENLVGLSRQAAEDGSDLELGLGLGDPTLADQIDAASYVTITIYLDDQDQVRQVDIDLYYYLPAFGDGPDATSLTWDITASYRYSHINEPVDPVIAPL